MAQLWCPTPKLAHQTWSDNSSALETGFAWRSCCLNNRTALSWFLWRTNQNRTTENSAFFANVTHPVVLYLLDLDPGYGTCRRDTNVSALLGRCVYLVCELTEIFPGTGWFAYSKRERNLDYGIYFACGKLQNPASSIGGPVSGLLLLSPPVFQVVNFLKYLYRRHKWWFVIVMGTSEITVWGYSVPMMFPDPAPE